MATSEADGLADRKLALNAIIAHARAAIQAHKQITNLVRQHGLAIPLPPDKPLLEVITHAATLKHERAGSRITDHGSPAEHVPQKS